MKWWGGIIVAVILSITVAAAVHWTFNNTEHSNMAEENCSLCHARSALQTHTQEFVAEEHGPIALADRSSCQGCHEDAAEECDDCHLEQEPKWHTNDFRNPALGNIETREHIRIANIHQDSCAECHNTTYMTLCANCHRPEEDWLGRGSSTWEQPAAPEQTYKEQQAPEVQP
ncbi:MAG: hypothetical protein GY746_00915 [Gammaproteobacteria bacterium]|nr:hypothetical protein [Gammaproteobacteria bacterium]MCP4088343.1 hypothetical protein [Gammaproteobacteria bacterium]MCP4275445.1 hypothetical protein [Gammaproteobacteria bacterium]MCP4830993.1 hypothetical protein [Gammaproteobacteria bacterium]MCP4927486.1 hypothetical protein [Gammaproteobacteria bacterium]